MTSISTKKKEKEKSVCVKMGPLLILLVASFIPLLNTLYGYHRDISTQRNITEHYFQRSHDVVSRFIDTDRAAAFDTLIAKLGSNTYKANATTYFHRGTPDGADINAPRPRENATLLMLVRNFEVDAAIESMRNLEDRFNKYYHYDWTFLNDVPFTNEFIEKTTAFASGKTQYALIPYDDWNRPPWIDEELFEQKLVEMEENNVIYGGSRSYRNMCRFTRVSSLGRRSSRITIITLESSPVSSTSATSHMFHPFRVMRLGKKKYGFAVSLYEYMRPSPRCGIPWRNTWRRIKVKLSTTSITPTRSSQIRKRSMVAIHHHMSLRAITICVTFGPILRLVTSISLEVTDTSNSLII